MHRLVRVDIHVDFAADPEFWQIDAGFNRKAGARQHTATVQLDRPAEEVLASMLSVAEQNPQWSMVSRVDRRYLLELTENDKRVTGQAMDVDSHSSLLFVWADAGNSGITGHDLALRAVNLVCDDLSVPCKIQDM